MPNTNSAKKALRQDVKRAKINLTVKKVYKEAVKVAKTAISAGKEPTDLIKDAQIKLDKAAKRGVIKKNTAARKLSRLMKMTKKVAK
jgi:small subunit ribosomal protein S20